MAAPLHVNTLPKIQYASVWDYAILPLITLENAALILLSINGIVTLLDLITLLNERIPR